MVTKKDETKAKTAPKKASPVKKPATKGADSSPPPADPKEKQLSPAEARQVFLKEQIGVARRLNVDRLLYICSADLPLDDLVIRALKKKVIVASPSDKNAIQAEELGLMHELIPDYAYDRFEKINIALGACVSSGNAVEGMRVLCLVGEHNRPGADTCMLTEVGAHSDEQAALSSVLADSEQSAVVLEAVLKISLSLGFDGIEGDPVGTIFVVGDSVEVMERSKQLTLNPFQGYSEEERNILDPSIRDAIKNFCLLDGAVIVREDGVLLAAGRYLRTPEDLDLDLPLGLGTRNAAAMGISQVSKAVTFVISKTDGTIRIYKAGRLAVELKQPRRRT